MSTPISGTLLFQGDSITNAFRRPDEVNDAYRMGNGYAFIIGSLLRATSGQAGLTVQNRGIAGDCAADLLFRWQRDCLDLRPDLLSILVGINDLGRVAQHGESAMASFTRSYDALLRQTAAALPRCRIVLMEPFALPVDAASAQRAALLAPIQAHVRAAAARIGAVLVPLQQAFDEVAGEHPERWIYDGIHPTAAGQWLMAQRWLEVVAGIRLPGPQAMRTVD
jgi:lysophospholipase L1-like esterase